MLRKIKNDLSLKPYFSRARELTSYHAELKEEIEQIIAKKKPNLAGSIRSVMRAGGTLVIRAESRAAMSELYLFRDDIMLVVKRSGAERVRLTV